MIVWIIVSLLKMSESSSERMTLFLIYRRTFILMTKWTVDGEVVAVAGKCLNLNNTTIHILAMPAAKIGSVTSKVSAGSTTVIDARSLLLLLMISLLVRICQQEHIVWWE